MESLHAINYVHNWKNNAKNKAQIQNERENVMWCKWQLNANAMENNVGRWMMNAK